MPSVPQEVTELLLAWSQGEASALEKLMPLVHKELQRLAHHYMAGERSGHSLQTTALVNEAYVRLVDCSRVHWQNRAHFFAVSAQLMRRILVDFARSHGYLKRGGSSWSFIFCLVRAFFSCWRCCGAPENRPSRQPSIFQIRT
jgi:RNA polymerase sigma factor (TIGR02999 family)